MEHVYVISPSHNRSALLVTQARTSCSTQAETRFEFWLVGNWKIPQVKNSPVMCCINLHRIRLITGNLLVLHNFDYDSYSRDLPLV